MSEKGYTYTFETNDDETGAFVRIECEVMAATKRSAASRIHKALAAVVPGITKDDIAEGIETED